MADNENIERIKSLSIWQGNIAMEPLSGGITNVNYLVKDGQQKLAAILLNIR